MSWGRKQSLRGFLECRFTFCFEEGILALPHSGLIPGRRIQKCAREKIVMED